MSKILIDEKALNYTRLMVKTDKLVVPAEEADQIRFCESIFNKLEKEGKILYKSNNKAHQIYIRVIELEQVYYLTVCFNHGHNDNIYINNMYAIDSQHDCMELAKVVRQEYLNISQAKNKAVKAEIKEPIIEA